LIDAFASLHKFGSRTIPPPLSKKKNMCFSTSSPEQSSTSGKQQNKSHVNSKRQQLNPPTTSNTTSTTTLFNPTNKSGNPNQNRNRHYGKHHHDNRNSIRIMFQTAKTMERQGRWGEAHNLLEKILQKNPRDSHSHLAIARLEARREGGQGATAATQEASKTQQFQTKAQIAFERGTKACPRNIFLLQAWAIYEQQNRGDMERARELFEEAVDVDSHNPFVCHAYSLMEKKLGNDEAAISLLKQVLDAPSAKVTAALVCTLGEIHIAAGNLTEARDLYQYHIDKIESSNMANANQPVRRRHLPTEKDRVEVYLAAAWLEERHFRELRKARDLLRKALAISPTSSLANVALARLEGRIQSGDSSSSSGFSSSPGQSPRTAKFRANRYNSTEAANIETAKRLATICNELHQQGMESKNHKIKNQQQNHDRTSASTATTNEDGRVFNALATLEVKNRQFREARDVLQKGMDLYPLDHNLFTAAGKVEERVGNYTQARDLYMESLRLEPSGPTLVAFALLELKYPQYPTTTSTETTIDKKVIKVANFTLIRGLFEEALMLDPRNGPAYNAYGNAEARRGNIEEARSVFERGTQANCSDAASIYHGYGMLEISVGNVEKARSILYKGLDNVREHQDAIFSDNPNRDRAAFLSHTLGMLELNSNRALSALIIFQEGIDRCGNSSQLLLGAALSEMRLGKDEAARSLFARSVYADKKHAQAWQAWGVMETKAGHFNRASALFQKGIRHAPWHGSLWHGYASLEVKRDNIENARTLFTGGLKKANNRHDALYQGWATLEMREGNYEKARKLISEALTRNKQNGRGWIIAAEIEEEDGHDGLALLMLRRGIECDPDNADLYRKLGDHLLGKGKIDDAREVYEKGIEINPMYAPLYHSLAELEARICNLGALSKLNKRTNELFNNNAMEPSPRSYQALETKIKNSSQHRPVSSFFVDRNKQQTQTAQGKQFSENSSGGPLAEKIGIDGYDDEDAEPAPSAVNDTSIDTNMSAIEELNGEGIVDDIMSVESILNGTTTKKD
jgi:tetratricopeptide (TPR) repeat protein